ncbi:MAG: protein jag, partial [Lachnospiraceae bacterium]|nr:protein jag [Lachnospiraceae bacterium]
LGLFKKEAKIRAKAPETIEQKATKFVTDVLEAMGVESEVEVRLDDAKETVLVNLNGTDTGMLIGKRGQTLDSLQYLVSLVINKDSEEYLKVKVDTENYRERRKETLENLAKNIAGRVKKSHKPVALEPMNPYERRIIHSALQNDKYVETHSEGDEPNRKVIVSLKKGVTFNNNYGRRGGYGQRGGNSYGGRQNQTRKMSTKEFHKKYGGNSKDYSNDYKKDYAAYLEEKAAARAAAENAGE